MIIHILNHDFRLSKDNSYEVLIFCAHIIDVPYLDCAMITLSSEEYSFNTSHLFYGEIQFETDDFIILPDGHAQVCHSVIEDHFRWRKRVLGSYRFISGALDSVHFSLSCLSVMGLVSTLVTYMKFKELRNLHSVSIIGLSVALLLANIFTVLSDKMSLSGLVCIAFAVITHYFWRAAFT